MIAVPRDVEYRLSCERESAAREEGRALAQSFKEAEAKRSQLGVSIEMLRKRLTGGSKTVGSRGSGKYLQTLEKRLNHSIVKFNELVASNTVLRDDVDSLRQEKQHFVKVEKGLLDETEMTKRSSDILVKKINACFAAKDKAVADLQHLRTMADREHFEFEREWKELNRLLELDARVSHQVVRAEISPKPEARVMEIEPVPPPEEEDTDALLTRELHRLESQFERIKEAVGTTSLSDLIDFFSSKEMQNFSLLNRSDFLSSEIAKADLLIADVDQQQRHIAMHGNHPARQISAPTRSGETETFFESKLKNMTALFQRIYLHVHSLSEVVIGGPGTSRTELPDEVSQESTVLSILAKIDGQLDHLIPQTTRRHTGKPLLPKACRVNTLTLPSSIAPLEKEESIRFLTRAEITPNLVLEPPNFAGKMRASSAGSTRPGTSSTINARKSITRPLSVIN